VGFALTYKPFGVHGLLIEWPQRIDESILHDILRFKTKIKSHYASKLLSINHAYASILMVFVEENFDFHLEQRELETLYEILDDNKQESRLLWKIPVCYDPRFGIDLEVLAKEKNLDVAQIIQRHSQPLYTVYFIGFLPGFIYLGGLDERLFTPRKDTPRLKVQKGSVAIGGTQTGVYPSESPGGWQIIGNSPINFFNIEEPHPCFAKAGDALKFHPVSIKTYNDIKTLVEAGVYQIESEVVDD